MAKKPKKAPVPSGLWNTDWPATGDLNIWLWSMFEKAQAIEEPSDRASQSMFALELLAKRGFAEEALEGLERVVTGLGSAPDPLSIVRLRERSAEICLDFLDDSARAEKYLDHILGLESLFTRRCDRGFARKQVEQFKVRRGLIDPARVNDPKERRQAAFNAAYRQAIVAIKRGEEVAARAALTEAERHVPDSAEWEQRFRYVRVINAYIELGDSDAVHRVIDGIPRPIRRDILLSVDLERVGARHEAVALNEDALREAMDKLSGGSDPNVHFVALALRRALARLVDLGETERARQWLRRVLDEGRSWELSGFGFASAGLFRILAKVTADLESPAEAAGLLGLAETIGQSETRSNWRAGAAAELLELHMEIGNFDEALRLAKKMRSPAGKRKALTKMLAKARRWSELIEVLREAQTPLEACELCWVVRFAIDPEWKD